MLEIIKVIRSDLVNSRKKENFYSRFFYRRISPYLSFFFIKLGISANSITWLSVVVALLGCFFISFSSLSMTIIGLILLQFWYLLDHTDGEVARFTKTETPEGLYLDVMTHNLVHPIIYFSFGLDVINNFPATQPLPFWDLIIPTRRIMLFLSFFAGLSALIIDLSSCLRYQIIIRQGKKRYVSSKYSEIILRFRNAHPVGMENPLFKLWHILWNIFCIPGAIWFLTAGSILRINYILIPLYALVLSILAITSIVVRLRSKINTNY